MWHLVWTETFTRRCSKLLGRNRQLEGALEATLTLLAENPRHPRLKLHALRGQMKGLWAVRVTYSVRLVIALDEQAQEAILIALGSHDEAYR